MDEEISRCKRSNASFTVMLIDIDHFKKYNDICGHLAGDAALRKTAKFSIGFSSFPGDGQTQKELINTADIALYRAKA